MRKLFTLLSAACCICVMFATEPMPVANAGFQKMLRRTASISSRKVSVHKATNEILSGSCGTNLTWSLDTSTGVLTITGSGAMTDFEDLYDASENWIGCSTPWYDYVTSITSVSLPSGLTTIGQNAFSDCTALTTISIPNGVTSIGGYAFYGCTALTSITLPNSITSIGEGAFYTSGINTPVYNNTVFAYLPTSYSGEYAVPNGITTIAGGAFADCTSLTAVEIPSSVTSIDAYAFIGSTNLQYILMSSAIPPTLGELALLLDWNNGNPIIVFVVVPCGSKDAYISESSWADYVNYIYDEMALYGYDINIMSSNKSQGTVEFTYDCDSIYMEATPKSDYIFWKWSDESQENPHSVALTSDTIIAYFTKIYSGTCGANLKWSLNTADSTLTITGTGAMRDYDYDVRSLKLPPWDSYLSKIKSVIISYGCTSIGNQAFINYSNLTSVTIPNSVTSIGNVAFYGCSNLNAVCISDIAAWCNINFSSYDANPLCYAHNIYLNNELVTDLVIPDSVTSIGSYAFRGCTSLTSIEIPNSVTSIGYAAFDGCRSLPVENNLRYADTYLVEAVDKTLPSYVIKEDTRWIGDDAFRNCLSLTSVTIPNSVTSIGNGAFSNCSLTSIDIPNSVTSIGYAAFRGCSSLTTIDIPNSVESIGHVAFSGCISLTSVTIPNSVRSIGHSAFEDCSSLTSVTIPNWITTIEDGAFSGCTGLISVTIPPYVTHIGSGAFKNCSSLTSVTIPKYVTSIGSSAFEGCRSLTSVTLNSDAIVRQNRSTDSNINHIFGSQVKEYILGNDITGIGTNAFYGCSNLETLSLGENISSYGNYAFAGCPALTSITNYRKTPAKLGTDAFAGVDYFNCTLYVLAGSVDMYKASGSDWKDFYYIKPIGTTETTVTEDKVTVSPADNTALFTWRMSEDASTYTLQITKDGVIFCTLSFDADGSLKGIAFAPGRGGQAHAPAATLTANGMQFTVTGLNAASKYAYRLAVTDTSDNLLVAYNGEFATTGYEGEVNEGGNPEGLDDVQSEVHSTKILRDGKILILRGDKIYTLQGQEVK
ncbi:MAG: leucine-rich repeat protein [Paludibacteraceae bacterium]|nr:leucine-rich repeat protein [Paludibacteraceae bacterium]